MLVLIYLGLSPRFFPKFAHPYAILALDAVTMLFWFAGFIALAVFENDFSYNVGFYSFGCGSVCGQFKAAVAFGALEWYVYIHPIPPVNFIMGSRLICTTSTGPSSSTPL